MSTTQLNQSLHVMAADALRVRAASQSGERVVAVGSRIGRALWQGLSAIGEGRARTALIALANEQSTSRPELAAQLRSAARRSWLD